MVVNVSPEDMDKITIYTWYITSHGYAASRINDKIMYMHRLILNAPKGVEVDHINGVKTDNTRENLRFANRSIQTRNIAKQKNNTSGVLGVNFCPLKQKWRAFLGPNRKAGLNSKEEAIEWRKKFEVADPTYIGRD